MTKHHPQRVSRVLPAGHLGLPLVAIVGRPNVGKSTLFNRLARRRLAIVHDEPGVTRDRNYANTTAFGRDYTLIDTGGFDPDSDDPMKSGIARHVRAAIAEADVIVFVTDATVPLTSADRTAVALLRESSKPVLFAANKADSPRSDANSFRTTEAVASFFIKLIVQPPKPPPIILAPIIFGLSFTSFTRKSSSGQLTS